MLFFIFMKVHRNKVIMEQMGRRVNNQAEKRENDESDDEE